MIFEYCKHDSILEHIYCYKKYASIVTQVNFKNTFMEGELNITSFFLVWKACYPTKSCL